MKIFKTVPLIELLFYTAGLQQGTKYWVGTQLTGASELGLRSYINLKILGGHVPVCPPYRYGPVIKSNLT